MDRKAIANETLRILNQGYYEKNGNRIEIADKQEKSVAGSRLIVPEDWSSICIPARCERKTIYTVSNWSAVESIRNFAAQKIEKIGVLNFASAKNPGGGFLNGAMAQEESLAASSGLYYTLTAHPEYYERNRVCKTMIYTDYAIYSPDVVFFRDGRFVLMESPVTASVLTMPAVNLGQVLLKGEDKTEAEERMRKRMRLTLAAFASIGDKNLVLGAYGCGVFCNDPEKVATWWDELLRGEFYGTFERVDFAVLDRSKDQACIAPFQLRF